MRVEDDKLPGVDGTKLPPKDLCTIAVDRTKRFIFVLYYCFPDFRRQFPDRRTILENLESFNVEFRKYKKEEEKETVYHAEYDKLQHEFNFVEQSESGGITILMSSRKPSGMPDDDGFGHVAYYETPASGDEISFSDNSEAVAGIDIYINNQVRDSQGQHQQK